MILNSNNLKEIRQFARDKIGGFGMWLELAEKIIHIGAETNYSFNMLTKCDNMVLSEFVDWKDLRKLEIELVDGFALLDFYVHDHAR